LKRKTLTQTGNRRLLCQQGKTAQTVTVDKGIALPTSVPEPDVKVSLHPAPQYMVMY